jgi:hypothetical protein
MVDAAVRIADAPVFIAVLPACPAACVTGLLRLMADWPVLTTDSPAFMAAAVVFCATSIAVLPACFVALSVVGAISLMVSPTLSIVEPATSSAAPTTRAAVPARAAAVSKIPPSSLSCLGLVLALLLFRLAIRFSLPLFD